MLERIHWLGHASFRLNGPPHHDGPVVYIDPWRLPPDAPAADLILISHDHHDHCSPEDIARIETRTTVIVGNRRAADLLGREIHVLREWQAFAHEGVTIRAVPAYTEEHVYHDRSYGGLGYLISMMRHDIYFAGDTGLIPEMTTIGCDIALLPVGGMYTMDCEQAVQAVNMINPRLAVPMHYGREIPGSRDDGQRFVQMVNGGAQAVELPVENERVFVS